MGPICNGFSFESLFYFFVYLRMNIFLENLMLNQERASKRLREAIKLY